MTDGPLSGLGVLVTRPRAQAAGLVEAIESAGGRAFIYPVIDIAPRKADAVAAKAKTLPPPDISVFVSANAVEYGLQYAGEGRTAAIGPATAAALRDAGRQPDILSSTGYDSESLLEETALQDVAGKNILIIRGEDGREYLADMLRERGALVHYLAVYERRIASPDSSTTAAIQSAWRAGQIQAVTVMSVATLENLIKLLPECCAERLADTLLVTPAARVIKEALIRYPASQPVLASGTGAAAMVQAIIEATATANNIGRTP